MPNVPALDVPLLYLLAALIVLTCVLICAAVYYFMLRLEETRRLRIDPLSVTHYHCRYCTWGVARMEDESVRFEGDDIVETRRFVCSRCGLPHWIVLRTSILKKVG